MKILERLLSFGMKNGVVTNVIIYSQPCRAGRSRAWQHAAFRVTRINTAANAARKKMTMAGSLTVFSATNSYGR